MLNRVLVVGLLAGLVAGLAVAVLQHFTTTPLILAAETYETAGKTAALAGPDFGGARIVLAHTGHEPVAGAEAEGWKPEDGLARTFFTGLTTVVSAIGFALVLLAGMIAAGDEIDARRALAWAAAAFLATGLAPALGLAPELPGAAAGPLVARQAWWVATAVATAASLWLFLRTEAAWAKVLAALLLVAPHAVGAPHPAGFESRVPAELAAQFAARSLAVQAALWLLTGLAVGLIWTRFARRVAA
ncbi:CbtA family protein [Chelatococcus sp. SYSU_G07232]|uniref:CbtA family protein n=1 Tax=Chelatococcus albus TaxID=3047466 RepID=A0ABT7AJR6_9HYPH|nr:CbtA family protein [Chelatococcus sp. SYSU_G07232]MDJ1158831.1 CbtA family protein [Chelatococcus sp. SYSU_G07232]